MLFKSKDFSVVSSPSGAYESFPPLAEIKDDKLIIDGYEPPSDETIKTLSDVATDLMCLYVRLDSKQHIFTYTAFVLERLFTMLHIAAYGDYLNKRNFVSEVGRLARSEERTYVPVRLPKDSMFELKPMTDFATSSSTLPPVSSSSEPYSYGK